ncbi:SurA N-terminal domain-containing protein [Ferrimonas lipolytica]|uniref:Periplasmic chaperone PpiD n=1 Tax=Ferrimonas lipolytica TaxID=2724191 RepID=A0A6H1UH91_9GAMM|nr:SurA N-terminal domain-containing protein [Ferrimonas lipolytica]QIZ77162.1 peptidylprolyl isomerase [Ferrimonas lipolytica]
MLEKIREGSQGVGAKIILSLVILSFALTGVYSYLGTNTGQVAAIVNGEEISRYDLDKAFQNEQNRMRSQMGEMFDTLMGDPTYMANMRQGVLDRMVSERLLDQKVAAMGLRVSDSQIQQAIVAMPEFQVDGKFNNEHYQTVLRQNNLTGSQIRDMMRTDMARQQLLMGLLGTEFATEAEAEALANLQQQTRDMRYVTVAADEYRDGINIGEAEAQAYYDNNPSQFVQLERVQLEYIELDVAELSKQIEIDEQDARDYYASQSNIYSMPERRLAAHMLFEGDDAKARAEAALARVRAGESFADVAVAESDDSFTAENGGELDWMTPGTMDEQFDNALFALEQGGVSEVLETDFGFQIVNAKQIEAGTLRPFEEVQAEINAALSADKAQQEFYDLQQQLADVSFEIPDSLLETAEAIGAEIQTSPMFDRNTAPAKLNNPKLLAAAFSDSVVLDKMNSDVIELGTNHMIVVRAKDYQKAGTLPFADVSEQISAQLLQQQASDLAQQQADQLLSDWKAGTAPADSTSVKAVNRMGNGILDSTMVMELFKMAKPTDGETIASIKLPTGDIAVMALDAVNAPAELKDLEMLRGRLGQQLGQSSYQALIASLRAEADVVFPQVVEQQ